MMKTAAFQPPLASLLTMREVESAMAKQLLLVEAPTERLLWVYLDGFL